MQPSDQLSEHYYKLEKVFKEQLIAPREEQLSIYDSPIETTYPQNYQALISSYTETDAQTFLNNIRPIRLKRHLAEAKINPLPTTKKHTYIYRCKNWTNPPVQINLKFIQTDEDSHELIYGIHPTPFGQVLIGICADHIAWISFLEIDQIDEPEKSQSFIEMKKNWSQVALLKNQDATAQYIRILFSPQSADTINLLLKGTPFQQKVWEIILQVQPGELISYQHIADAIRSPQAFQAIGNAVGANNLAYIIPCHRIIRKDGILDHYRWNPNRKKIMLAIEQSIPLKIRS